MTRLLFMAGLAACGGGAGGSTDIDGTLRFADLNDIEISRLVNAAAASEGFAAQSQLSQFDDPFEDDPCPVVTEDAAAATVTITGGCTNLDEHLIEGSATIVNPLGWGELEYDFTSPSVYTFDAFSITVNPTLSAAFDGVVETGPQFGHLDFDITLAQLGLTVRSDLFMDCSATECEHGESGIELVGVGGARVSGTIAVAGQSAVGALALRGVDTVSVAISQGCVEWTLDGTGRSLATGNCPQ